jgi:hypothetical protein
MVKYERELFCIWKIPGSILGPEAGHLVRTFMFSSVCAKYGIDTGTENGRIESSGLSAPLVPSGLFGRSLS